MPRARTREPAKRLYLPRDARRQQIIDAARPVFAAKPIIKITIADLAEAAGVSPALIQHYFGTVTDVFMAVIAVGASAQVDARSEGPPTPLKKRIDINVPASLDVVQSIRDIWYAVMGHGHTSGNEQVDAIRRQVNEANVERTLAVFADVLTDTPATRIALRAQIALWAEITRALLDGDLTRAEAEAFIKSVNYAVVKTAIPAMERAAPPTA